MPRKGAKLPSNKAKASKATAVTAGTADDNAATLLKEPPAARPTEDGATTPRSREGTPDGHIRSIELDQNGNEIAGKDKTAKSLSKQEI